MIRLTNENIKEGALIMVDDAFSCIKPWAIVQILKDDGGYYFTCNKGRHDLDGQYDDDRGFYVGVYLVHP